MASDRAQPASRPVAEPRARDERIDRSPARTAASRRPCRGRRPRGRRPSRRRPATPRRRRAGASRRRTAPSRRAAPATRLIARTPVSGSRNTTTEPAPRPAARRSGRRAASRPGGSPAPSTPRRRRPATGPRAGRRAAVGAGRPPDATRPRRRTGPLGRSRARCDQPGRPATRVLPSPPVAFQAASTSSIRSSSFFASSRLGRGLDLRRPACSRSRTARAGWGRPRGARA